MVSYYREPYGVVNKDHLGLERLCRAIESVAFCDELVAYVRDNQVGPEGHPADDRAAAEYYAVCEFEWLIDHEGYTGYPGVRES